MPVPLTHPSSDAVAYPDYLRCLRCGLCLAVCPTYRVRGLETSSPRGRVALARALAQGELKATPELSEHLSSCLDCLACAAMCPAGVQISELVQDSRAALARQQRPSLFPRLALGQLWPYSGPREAAAWVARLYRSFGLQALAKGLGLSRLKPSWGVASEVLPPLPIRNARPRLAGTHPARGKTKARVGFFLGCVQDLAFPQVARASVALLQAQGYEVVVPSGLACCGKPLAAGGQIETARKLARRNLQVFAGAGVEAVVTDCATCGDFLQGYGHLLVGDAALGEKARAFSGRVQDISRLLASVPSQGRLKCEPLRVTYHEPCHLARGQGLREEPRRLLRSIPGLELVEMAEADGCCGGAGIFSLGHPELSLAILDRKMANIVATGAEVVATGCPGCILQLRLGARRHGLTLRVVHPVELLVSAQGSGAACRRQLPSCLDSKRRER